MCATSAHLLQVDVGLPDLLNGIFGERGVPQQKARQRLVVSQEVLQLEACGRKSETSSLNQPIREMHSTHPPHQNLNSGPAEVQVRQTPGEGDVMTIFGL